MTTSLSISFSLQAVFGTFLLMMGDILNGPLFIFSGCFALNAIHKKQKLISAGLFYMMSMIIFFITKTIELVLVDESIQDADASMDEIKKVRTFWIVTSCIVLITEVIAGTFTLFLFKRFYLSIDSQLPKLNEKAIVV